MTNNNGEEIKMLHFLLFPFLCRALLTLHTIMTTWQQHIFQWKEIQCKCCVWIDKECRLKCGSIQFFLFSWKMHNAQMCVNLLRNVWLLCDLHVLRTKWMCDMFCYTLLWFSVKKLSEDDKYRHRVQCTINAFRFQYAIKEKHVSKFNCLVRNYS